MLFKMLNTSMWIRSYIRLLYLEISTPIEGFKFMKLTRPLMDEILPR